MEIYREEREGLFDFLKRTVTWRVGAEGFCSTPAVCNARGAKELGKNQMGESQVLQNSKVYARSGTDGTTAHSPVSDELSQVTKEEYAKYPHMLPLAECFLKRMLCLP